MSIIRLKTESCRILPLTYATKFIVIGNILFCILDTFVANVKYLTITRFQVKWFTVSSGGCRRLRILSFSLPYLVGYRLFFISNELQPRACPSTVSSITTPGSYLSPVPLSSTGTTPVTSLTPRQGQETLTAEQMVTDYCCYGKFPLLHFIVISLLLGITLLIVGLVQLKPNADSEVDECCYLQTATWNKNAIDDFRPRSICF